MDSHDIALVTGAGGFIGGHLVAELRRRGHRRIRAVDCKPHAAWRQSFGDVDNLVLDLREAHSCEAAARGARYVFNLAADVGGIGFGETNRAASMLNVLINTNMLRASRQAGVERYLFSSSATVYPATGKKTDNAVPLREEDAYPAAPEDGYGWEKLFSERMCRHFMEDFGLLTRLPRYHNVYGPYAAYEGGREKAPAAICRKVIHAELTRSNEIEIWGDGEQTRTFVYIDDSVAGTLRLMESDVGDPVNIDSDQPVTINQLVGIVERIAGVSLRRRHRTDAPTGAGGRVITNALARQRLGWTPSITLEEGMRHTYEWIRDRMTASRRNPGIHLNRA